MQPTPIDAGRQLRRKRELRDGMVGLDGSISRHPANNKVAEPPYNISDSGRFDPVGDLTKALTTVAKSDCAKDPATVARAILHEMAGQGWAFIKARDI